MSMYLEFRHVVSQDLKYLKYLFNYSYVNLSLHTYDLIHEPLSIIILKKKLYQRFLIVKKCSHLQILN